MVMATTGWSQSTPPAMPTICTTPPAGYLPGGAMTVSPPISCVGLGGSTLTDVKITNKNDPNRNVFVDNPIFQ